MTYGVFLTTYGWRSISKDFSNVVENTFHQVKLGHVAYP